MAVRHGIVSVARKAGVSPACVSRVLAKDPTFQVSMTTRQRVAAAAEELGYVSDARARQLRQGVSTIFGVLIRDLGSTYGSQFFHHLSLGMAEMDREVLLGVHCGDMRLAKEHLDRFRAYRTFGILTITYPSEPAEWVAALSKETQSHSAPGMAVSFGGHTVARPGLYIDYDCVCERFLQMAVADHRRAALLALRGGGSDTLTEAFRRHCPTYPMGAEAITVVTSNPEVVAAQVVPRVVEWRARGPVAVMTSVDTDAIIIMRELLKRGLSVPQDVAVLGYGNMFFAQLSSPAISTVDISGTVPRMAAKVIELVKEMEGSKTLEAKEYPFGPDIVVRESFTPPAGWDKPVVA